MVQPDEDGYIIYPGLTGFPTVLGHEFSGVVIEAGPGSIDKRTNKPFRAVNMSVLKRCCGAVAANPVPMDGPITVSD